jgi:hypothetical protein
MYCLSSLCELNKIRKRIGLNLIEPGLEVLNQFVLCALKELFIRLIGALTDHVAIDQMPDVGVIILSERLCDRFIYSCECRPSMASDRISTAESEKLDVFDAPDLVTSALTAPRESRADLIRDSVLLAIRDDRSEEQSVPRMVG